MQYDANAIIRHCIAVLRHLPASLHCFSLHIWFRSRAANGQEDRASLHSGERVQLGEKWICSRWLQEQPDCSPDDNLSIEE